MTCFAGSKFTSDIIMIGMLIIGFSMFQWLYFRFFSINWLLVPAVGNPFFLSLFYIFVRSLLAILHWWGSNSTKSDLEITLSKLTYTRWRRGNDYFLNRKYFTKRRVMTSRVRPSNEVLTMAPWKTGHRVFIVYCQFCKTLRVFFEIACHFADDNDEWLNTLPIKIISKQAEL